MRLTYREVLKGLSIDDVFARWQLTNVPDSLGETFEFPSREFIEWAAAYEETPFQRMKPSFLLRQIHRHWVTVNALKPHLKDAALFVDIGSWPFYVPIAVRRFLGYQGRILATAVQGLSKKSNEMLGAHGIEATAVDLDPRVLDENTTALPKTIPLADASADVVLMSHVIEHLYHPMDALREARRILRPGGTIMVITDNGEQLYTLINVLSGAGYVFEPVEMTAAMNMSLWRGHVRFFTATDWKRCCARRASPAMMFASRKCSTMLFSAKPRRRRSAPSFTSI